MSHTVHKYALTVDDEQFLGLPRSARILRVECQHGASDDVLQLWVWVKPKDPIYRVGFLVVGTGNPAPPPEAYAYVGTANADDAPVWHVFANKHDMFLGSVKIGNDG